MIAIINSGNSGSVKNALECLGEECIVTEKPQHIGKADKLVLPGVGSFGFMMQMLKEKRLDEAIKKSIENGRPFLGICLGLQALFEESEESRGIEGLGISKGKVMKFRKGRIPQIGWNKIIPRKKGIFEEGYAYFVNSYYVSPEDKNIIATGTDYFGDFCSAIQKDNIIAVQFHPEKSGRYGLEFLRRWLKC